VLSLLPGQDVFGEALQRILARIDRR